MARKIDAAELVLCATNESALYAEHKALARFSMLKGATDSGSGWSAWEQHIRLRVLPHLDATMKIFERYKAATDLRDYYENHIREGA